MENVKAVVKKFNPYHKDVQKEWVGEFIDDLVRNEGKTVTLYDYYSDGYHTDYTLKSENGVEWHRSGCGTWAGNEPIELTNMIFHVIKESHLPEDLFTI